MTNLVRYRTTAGEVFNSSITANGSSVVSLKYTTFFCATSDSGSAATLKDPLRSRVTLPCGFP